MHMVCEGTPARGADWRELKIRGPGCGMHVFIDTALAEFLRLRPTGYNLKRLLPKNGTQAQHHLKVTV